MTNDDGGLRACISHIGNILSANSCIDVVRKKVGTILDFY